MFNMTMSSKYIKLLFISLIIACCLFFLLKYSFPQIDKYSVKFNNFLYDQDHDYKPKKIIIKGCRYLNENDLIREINLITNNFKSDNYFQVIFNSFKKNKLIKNFSIITKSKDLIEIEIIEKIIVALFSKDGIIYLIDKNNQLNKVDQIDSFLHLPYFIGSNSYNHADEILRLIENSGYNFEISSLEYVSQRRWNLNLKNEVKILLPEKNISKSLKSLINLHYQYNILNGNFVEVDLRIDDKYFFKPKINKDYKINN